MEANHGKFGRTDKDLFEISMDSALPIVKKYGDAIDLEVVLCIDSSAQSKRRMYKNKVRKV